MSDKETPFSAIRGEMIDPGVASYPLRICCYGSSSSKTPQPYLEQAYKLGYTLAKRGHTCVNGAGLYGCMGAMNSGASDGDGHVIGVIHEMFLVDNADWKSKIDEATDVGSHKIFGNGGGGTRTLLVAKGNDLQERKRMLMDGADALIVLPGGCGTFDELWEMACARGLGLVHMPIVCVNVNGFYKPFEDMLKQAQKDELIHVEPSEIIHFEPTSAKAVEYIETRLAAERVKEQENGGVQSKKQPILRRKTSILENIYSSIMSSEGSTFLLTLTTGIVIGATAASLSTKLR